MKTVLAIATFATAFISGPATAATNFEGTTVNFSYYYPDAASLAQSVDVVVGPGIEVPNVALDPDAKLNISSNTILVNFFRPANWSAFAFNGWVISDRVNGLNSITGVTISPASNWAVFGPSNISFTADSITVNWAGLRFDPSNSLLLDVTFASDVPEPATWGMMLLGFGFVGGAIRSAKRRQRLSVSYA